MLQHCVSFNTVLVRLEWLRHGGPSEVADAAPHSDRRADSAAWSDSSRCRDEGGVPAPSWRHCSTACDRRSIRTKASSSTLTMYSASYVRAAVPKKASVFLLRAAYDSCVAYRQMQSVEGSWRAYYRHRGSSS